MAEHRFFVPPESLAGPPSSVSLRGPEHHHLSRVLRLRPGAAVALFDGEGLGFEGVLESVDRDESRITLSAPDLRSVEPVFRLTLAQGIPSHDKMDLIVQKATEIGVWNIQPVIAHRTMARAAAEPGVKRLERWRRIAREAARQSGRLCVPKVIDPVPWEALCAETNPGGEEARFVLCPETSMDETGSSRALGLPAPRSARGEGARAGMVAVGPEGGWTAEELAAAARGGFVNWTLGPRVLRTETAGIVAVTLVLAWAGELAGAPGKTTQS